MKKILILIALLSTFLVGASPSFNRQGGEPQIQGPVKIYGALNTTGVCTMDDDLIVDGGEIGVTGDLDLLQLSSGDLDVNGTSEFNGNMTLEHSGATADSYKVVFQADTGGQAEIGSIYVSQDVGIGVPGLMIAAPDVVTGDETPVFAILSNVFGFATDDTVDIGANGAFRPKDIWLSGNLNAQAGYIKASGNVTAGGDLLVEGGQIGMQVDPDLFDVASGAATINGTLDVNGNITMDNTGDNTNSFKLNLVSQIPGENQTSSLFTAFGADPYLVVATPNATGVETNTLHIDHNSFQMAVDNFVDIGAAAAGRPKDYHGSGSIVTNGSVTATTGDITATAGDVVAGDDVFDVLGDVRMIYPVVSADDPDQPFDCTAAVLGRNIIVDDTNDASNQVVCVCLGVDDVINYEWQRADDNSTICPSLP